MMKPRIPKPISGHFDRSFFFEVSRGRFRNSKKMKIEILVAPLRCPEVGLGIQKKMKIEILVAPLGVRRSD